MPQASHVQFEVINADALSFEVDVLVLKHAQESLGVDAAVKERLGLDQDLDLAPGEHLILDGQPMLGAEKVVFLGVPSIGAFGYEEIELFARRAVSLVGTELPDTRQIALTLHGAGYGLDEIGCFDAELGGLVDAFDRGGPPPSLERVLILEYDERRAERLRRHLDGESSGDGPAAASVVLGGVVGTLGAIASAAPADQNHAFVAMPFSPKFEDVFHYGISPSIRANGLLSERIDQEAFTGNVLARMKEKIRTANLVVADLTEANQNVYLEVGFAWAADVPTVLLYSDDSDLKFDVQSERCLRYTSIKELEERLTKELGELGA